jgi:type I restriction enzyme S subunit
MYGEGKTRGKCSELLIPATINQAIAALVLEGYSENVKAYLKLYLLNSYEKMRTYASGGVQPNLNLQIIKSISIPLPSIDEQTEINKLINLRFENIELQKIAVEVGIKKLINQRKNILRDAFSGKLVNQNIADEPVSILLERIQAQRKAQQSLPKQKRVIKKIKGSQNMAKTLIEVLAEAGNWLPAQEAFRRCGVSDGASTDEIEAIYSELRQLDQTKKLEVNTVYYDDGRKQFDRIRLLVKA